MTDIQRLRNNHLKYNEARLSKKGSKGTAPRQQLATLLLDTIVEKAEKEDTIFDLNQASVASVKSKDGKDRNEVTIELNNIPLLKGKNVVSGKFPVTVVESKGKILATVAGEKIEVKLSKRRDPSQLLFSGIDSSTFLMEEALQDIADAVANSIVRDLGEAENIAKDFINAEMASQWDYVENNQDWADNYLIIINESPEDVSGFKESSRGTEFGAYVEQFNLLDNVHEFFAENAVAEFVSGYGQKFSDDYGEDANLYAGSTGDLGEDEAQFTEETAELVKIIKKEKYRYFDEYIHESSPELFSINIGGNHVEFMVEGDAFREALAEQAEVSYKDWQNVQFLFEGANINDQEQQERIIDLVKETDNKLADVSNINDRDDYIEITIGNEEYAIFRDENQAKEGAREDIRNFIDDVGVTGFTKEFWISHVNEERLGKDLAMDERNRAYDEPDSYLNEEPEGEDGDWTEEQREKAQEKAEQRITDDPLGYLEDIYGDLSEAEELLKNYVDETKLIEDAIDTDGIAHFLGRYDGNEIELVHSGLAYRQN